MRFPLRLILTILFIAASAVVCFAQTPTPTPTPTAAPAAPPAQATTTSPMPAGFRGEFLRELADIERKYISLAESIPADKFTWRPGEGVRSISEVFMHVAAANFNLPRLIGTPPPEGFALRGFETSTTDKARVTETMRQSFAHLRQAALRVADADSERTFPWFGATNTYRGHFLFMTRHLAEHLGQMIAYARMNGVVPAWTEERQRQQQQQQQRPQTPAPQPQSPPRQP